MPSRREAFSHTDPYRHRSERLGKTSLLEAMLALTRSTEKPLADAFLGDWQGRDLVFAGEEKPAIQLEVRFGVAEGKVHSPISYRVEVEFDNQGRSCRRIDEYS